MIFSDKLQLAIRIAATAHNHQNRKVSGLPAILHPMSVAMILMEVDASEEVIIAALLHDTLEDTDLSESEIEKHFGQNVLRMVKNVTEDKTVKDWKVRKQQALEKIVDFDKDTMLIKTADVLHNLSDQIYDYQNMGDELFEKFSSSKQEQLERYQKIVEQLDLAWSGNPLLPELKKKVEYITKTWI